jgi:heparan-alpha-glucosaminide N-acetyltransferase
MMSQGSAASESPTKISERLVSLDVYRGIVMLLLVFFDAPNGWTSAVITAHGEGTWQRAFARQFEHVEWQGLTLWDMVQPSFMFVVGVAVAYSYAARARRGDSFWRMLGHAAWRALLLILLGVFLRSAGHSETRWTFEDVVTQIGLGYVFLFLLWNRGWKIQLAAVAAILLGYWALFAAWPLPGPSYDYAAVEGEAFYDGFQAHWNKNAHPAHYFDQWLLNLFPRSEPFVANGGGYNTLNFVPSLATMIVGLMAGELLRGAQSSKRKLALLVLGGLACGAIGATMHYGGVCPVVKRIWTPSFALVSGGICLLTLAMLYAMVDMAGWRKCAFTAIVVGMNPIAAYVMIHLAAGWIVDTLQRHFGTRPFNVLGSEFQPMLENWSVGLTVWLVCLWMYRRRIFLRL